MTLLYVDTHILLHNFFSHLEERDIHEVWWTQEKCTGTESKASSLMVSVYSAGSCWAGSWRRKVISLFPSLDLAHYSIKFSGKMVRPMQ